jgi:hypothetical protein
LGHADESIVGITLQHAKHTTHASVCPHVCPYATAKQAVGCFGPTKVQTAQPEAMAARQCTVPSSLTGPTNNASSGQGTRPVETGVVAA